MTDSQIIEGIKNNDERTWRYVCRTIGPGFFASLRKIFQSGLSNDQLEDIFQDSLLILMNKVKSAKFVSEREGAVFSYLVQIGKLQTMNRIRKSRELTDKEKAAVIDSLYGDDVASDVIAYKGREDMYDLLDRLINSLPEQCQMIMKYFYWNKKSMDDIAPMIGMRNADSVKTKKNKCMNKLRDFAGKIVADEDFAESEICDAVQRNQLKALIVSEMEMLREGIAVAALDSDEEEK